MLYSFILPCFSKSDGFLISQSLCSCNMCMSPYNRIPSKSIFLCWREAKKFADFTSDGLRRAGDTLMWINQREARWGTDMITLLLWGRYSSHLLFTCSVALSRSPFSLHQGSLSSPKDAGVIIQRLIICQINQLCTPNYIIIHIPIIKPSLHLWKKVIQVWQSL